MRAGGELTPRNALLQDHSIKITELLGNLDFLNKMLFEQGMPFEIRLFYISELQVDIPYLFEEHPVQLNAKEAAAE